MIEKKKKPKSKSKSSRQVKKTSGLALVEEIVRELFSLLGTQSRSSVAEDKENEAILVSIETGNEAGLLIGNRGETLDSIQLVLGMIYRRRLGEWKRILVNVADWRERQEDRLTRLAIQTAERAKASGEAQLLYNLSPSQRRMIHLALVDDKGVMTESQGEGRERYLIVRPK